MNRFSQPVPVLVKRAAAVESHTGQLQAAKRRRAHRPKSGSPVAERPHSCGGLGITICQGAPFRCDSGYFYAKDWHAGKQSAMNRVKDMATNKEIALKKQLAQLDAKANKALKAIAAAEL